MTNKTTKTATICLLLVIFMAFAVDNRPFEISKSINIFSNVMRQLDKVFVDDIDVGKLATKSIKSMLETLDPYTEFYSETETDKVAMMTMGEYAGIGAIIAPKNGKIIIRQPYTNSPAQKAGLLPGDTIISINSTPIINFSTEKVSELLKGKPKTSFTITIKRHGIAQPMSFNAIREEIQMPSIPYYGMLDKETGYIYLVNFTHKAAEAFKAALLNLQEKGATSLVIDLRDNGGGSLEQAVNIVGLFVPKNSKTVTMKGKTEEAVKNFYTRHDPIAPDIPLTVLINRNTASASEIVSGSLQDYDRAVILGERSFGKGLVQTVVDLPYKTKMKITTAKYYIPSGRCIQALDYSNRKPDGSVGKVPDSLITAFKTQIGRTVYDGGGILPDIQLTPTEYTNVTLPIMAADKIFDFVSQYALKNKNIALVKEFRVTDGLYNEFKNFLKKEKFDYESETQVAINTLIEKAKKEKYYEKNKVNLEKMKAGFVHSLNQDMDLVKDEIKELLAYAFIIRYYNNEGAVEYRSQHDEQVKRAMKTIKNKTEYDEILKRIM